LFGHLQGVSHKDIRSNMQHLLKTLGLEDALHKRIHQLSGGMRKRADLAVAMIHDPDIVVLDEPFNGLDVSLQSFIWDHIARLSKDGKIVIITSHIIEDIEKHCNIYGMIAKGKFYNHHSIKAGMKSVHKSSLKTYLEHLFAYYHNG
jgi:sodium transport system ATP-binding protein